MKDFSEATAITMNAYQQIASSYAEAHKFTTLPKFWQERLQRFTSVLQSSPVYQKNPSLPVLDVGCGPGRDSLLLAQMGFRVIASDLSDAMLAEAQSRSEGQHGAERISFQRMDMRALDLPDNSCAGLWISASFLHIPKQENRTVLKELARVLVSGGPMMLLLRERDSGAMERYDVDEERGMSLTRFYAYYSGSELWVLIEEAGLQVIEITTSPDVRFPERWRWLGALAIKP